MALNEGAEQISVIGAGRWGPNLIRNFYSIADSKVVAVGDQSASRLEQIQARYKGVEVTTDIDALISDERISSVVIATPTNTHFELVKKALNNGKHVFVEKPLAETPEECRELVALAEKQKRVLFVGHVFVYNAGIRAVKKYIDSHSLGQVHYVQMTRTNLGPVRSDVSALWDLAPHDLSILEYLFGEMPTTVSAVGGRFLQSKLEDVVFANYLFSENIIANVHVSWLNPKKIREMLIVGDKKMLLWDDMDIQSPIRLFDKSITVDHPSESIVDTFVDFRATIHEGETLIPKVHMNEPLYAECEAFLEAIHYPERSASDGNKGKMIVEALAATDQSIESASKQIDIVYK